MILITTARDNINNALVIRIDGHADPTVAGELQVWLGAYARSRPPAAVVDLSDLHSLSGSAVRAMLGFICTVHEMGGEVAVAVRSRAVRAALAAARLGHLSTIESTVDRAAANFGRRRRAA